jgi:uncharacterized membrane protein YdjX (TVP38/TMEM64 family)
MKKLRDNWFLLVLLLIFAAILYLAGREYFSRYPTLSSENLDQFIGGFGPWAIGIFALAFLVASPIPFMGVILSATGGLLFGALPGAALSILISTATSLVPFTMSRRMGREWVEAKLKGSKLNKYYEMMKSEKGGFTFILLLRLVPVLPWELQNYVAGVTPIAIPKYLLATILGCTPMTLSLALLGAAAKKPDSWQFPAAIGLVVVVLVVPILIMVVKSRKGGKPA